MKALWNHDLYVILETHHSHIDLELVDSECEDRVTVSLADPSLIIDPTDGDLDEAEVARSHRESGDCAHMTYHTLSVSQSLHHCDVCGATFKDAHRTKHYTHFKNSHLS